MIRITKQMNCACQRRSGFCYTPKSLDWFQRPFQRVHKKFPLLMEGLEFIMLVSEGRHYRVCGVEVESFEVLVGSVFILRQRLLPQGIEASHSRTIHRVRRI